ncbi:MAG: WG repeat-containing protein [Cytophagales bacterium]|nr:WG repeat-containing protein [Cytophagales bacterium]
MIIPVTYKRIHSLGTLRYAVENETGKIALYREDGRAITDFKIDSIAAFDKSRAIIYQNLNQGLLDRDGNIIIEPVYQSIKLLDGDRAKVLAHHQDGVPPTERNQVQRSSTADDLYPLMEKYLPVF